MSAKEHLYGGFVRADTGSTGKTALLKVTVGLGAEAALPWSGRVSLQRGGTASAAENIQLQPGESRTITWRNLGLPRDISVGLGASVPGDDGKGDFVTLAGASLPEDAEEINQSGVDEAQERIEALEQEAERRKATLEDLDRRVGNLENRVGNAENRIGNLEDDTEDFSAGASAGASAEADVEGTAPSLTDFFWQFVGR